MGRNIPQSRFQALQWLETRTPLWNPDPTLIGLTTSQSSEIISRTGAARTAWNNVLASRAAAASATQAWYEAADSMRSYGGDLVSAIKAFAQTTGNPDVYEIAQVSPPEPRSALPPPNQPADVTTLLRNDGSVEIRWKGAQPAGTRYTVHRRLAGENMFALLGDSGADKTFTDSTIAAGTTSATYYIVARRAEVASPASEQTTIAFGIGGNQGQALTLAA